MKIIYHHRTLGDGAEGIHIEEMVNAFKNLGNKVKVVSLTGSKTNVQTARSQLWGIVKNCIPKVLYEAAEILYNCIGFYKLNRTINTFEPDFIYDRYTTYNASSILVAKKNGIPLVLEVNAPLAHERQIFGKLYFPKIAQRFERWICSNSDITVVVSTPLRDYLVNLGVPKNRMVIMPNGVNLDKFRLKPNRKYIRTKYNIDDKIVLGFVGEFRPWHGLEMLLQAFGEIDPSKNSLHLLLIGSGPSQISLEKQAKENDLDNYVTFTGRIPHNKMKDFISAMDITISPRTTFYASPMKILEYMAMSKPIVAPRMTNIEDLIEHNKDGILFEPENREELKSALLRLIHSEALRHELGFNARRKVELGYTWENNAKKILELISASSFNSCRA
jgi:glycosyltransferase involved in cell wall biosynthesis